MTDKQIAQWCWERVKLPTVINTSKSSMTLYWHFVKYQNGDTFEFIDEEGQPKITKINGAIVRTV